MGSSLTTAQQLFGTVAVYPGKQADQVAVGTTPWTLDPLPASAASPLASGAFFKAPGNGQVTPYASAATSCADATLPTGSFCREVALVKGMPDGTQPTTGTAYTLWIRVIRVGDPVIASNPSMYAVVDREVLFQ